MTQHNKVCFCLLVTFGPGSIYRLHVYICRKIGYITTNGVLHWLPVSGLYIEICPASQLWHSEYQEASTLRKISVYEFFSVQINITLYSNEHDEVSLPLQLAKTLGAILKTQHPFLAQLTWFEDAACPLFVWGACPVVQCLNILGEFKYRCIVLQHLRPFVSGGRSLLPRFMHRYSLLQASFGCIQVSFVTRFVCMCSWGTTCLCLYV